MKKSNFLQILYTVFGILFSLILVTSFEEAHANSLNPMIEAQPMVPWTPPDFAKQYKKALGYDDKTFSTPESMKADVQFWIDIYTKYTTRQGVFHLVGNTEKILGEIDLTDVYSNQKWGPIRREKEAELIVRIQKRMIAKKHHIKNLSSIRLQMGLKDRMQEAIKLSGYYMPMMEKIFEEKNLPIELTRLVFVESSFNIEAGSKVGASGLWQIMPRVARKYKYIQPSYDKREHAYYSTLLAAQILRENYIILKSWPLAVTGYNHGVGSMQKIVKKYKSRDIGFLTENVKSKKSFGFASKNFYATFLAALHVESHANLYFPEPIMKYPEIRSKDFKLAKKMKFEELLALFDNDKDKLKLYNPHVERKFLKPGKTLPAKTLVSLPSDSRSGALGDKLIETD